MTIPDYQTLMLPLLRLLRDRQEHALRDAIDRLGSEFGLSETERKALLPSGKQAVFDNRVGWARTYMKKAGLLEQPGRALMVITQRGLDMLRSSPARIEVSHLVQFPEFKEWRESSLSGAKTVEPDNGSHGQEHTPEEQLELAYQRIRGDLAVELLALVKSCPPAFFERLVVELLVKMGYGGSRRDAGEAIGRSGDGGIDGIIKEDRLGLDIIYIQAKRWDGVVGRPEIQKFAGALQGHRANKGVFITTSGFTRDALEFVGMIGSKIVLIDGEQLTQLMIDFDLGVARVTSYELKRVDSDYFLDE